MTIQECVKVAIESTPDRPTPVFFKPIVDLAQCAHDRQFDKHPVQQLFYMAHVFESAAAQYAEIGRQLRQLGERRAATESNE
jgi:hypothetical protein